MLCAACRVDGARGAAGSTKVRGLGYARWPKTLVRTVREEDSGGGDQGRKSKVGEHVRDLQRPPSVSHATTELSLRAPNLNCESQVRAHHFDRLT